MSSHHKETPPTPENPLDACNMLVQLVKRGQEYLDQPSAILPTDKAAKLQKELTDTANRIQDNQHPTTLEQLFEQEAKRRLRAEAVHIRLTTSAQTPPWEEIATALGVSSADLSNLESWLKDNLENVKQANLRRFTQGNFAHRTKIPLGIHPLRQAAEKVVQAAIDTTISILPNMETEFPGISKLSSEYLIAPDSKNERSFFDRVGKVVGISCQGTTYLKDGQVYLVPEQFLRIFGHEVVGHVYQDYRTGRNQLPQFLRTHTAQVLQGEMESVSRYFQDSFVKSLANRPDITDSLSLTEPFKTIYQRYQDTFLMREYWEQLGRFTIFISARSKPEKPNARLAKIWQAIRPYAIDPSYMQQVSGEHYRSVDPQTGRLKAFVVAELRYAADPVSRILAGSTSAQQYQVEQLLPIGFWTPIGLEQWVRLKLNDTAQNHVSSID